VGKGEDDSYGIAVKDEHAGKRLTRMRLCSSSEIRACWVCNQARIDKYFLNVADLRKMLEKGKSKEDVADAAKLKLGRPRNDL
jgi:hypothetical protein